MGQTHTLAILLTILFHTLEQVGTVIEFVTIAPFWRFSRFPAVFQTRCESLWSVIDLVTRGL